jgi:2-oxoglutarate ferredoxin oxidoreductase subunit beta
VVGQKTTTSPLGRDKELAGYPVKMSEMLATMEGACYVARVSVHNAANVIKAKRAIKEAFKIQMQGLGFAIVEVLSTCPTNWGLSPTEALKWLEQNMIPQYPLGVYKTPAEVK